MNRVAGGAVLFSLAFVAQAQPTGRAVIAGRVTYYIAAVAQLPRENGWPGLLEALKIGASTVVIAEGQQRSVDLRLPGR